MEILKGRNRAVKEGNLCPPLRMKGQILGMSIEFWGILVIVLVIAIVLVMWYLGFLESSVEFMKRVFGQMIPGFGR